MFLRPSSRYDDPTAPEPVADWSTVDGWYRVDEPNINGARVSAVAVRITGSWCGTDLVPTEVEYTSRTGHVFHLPCTAWTRPGTLGTGTTARVAEAIGRWVEREWQAIQRWADERVGAV